MRALLALVAIGLATPAYADCQRSPFSGVIVCGETAGMFQNEEVPSYTPPARRRHVVCESHRFPGGFDTDCHEE